VDLRIGTSVHADVGVAVAEAAGSALAASRSPAFAFVLATFDYAPDALASAACASLGAVRWAGALTHAVLVGSTPLTRGVAVGVIDSARVRVGVGIGGPASEGARAAGRIAASEALARMPLPPADRSRAMILLADTATCDAGEALHGALSVAGAGIGWGGGGTGPGPSGAPGALFAGGAALRDRVIAIALDGPARIGVGVQHGWAPTGAPAMVTRAVGPVLVRLDDAPAFETYRAAADERGEILDARNFVAFATTHPLGTPQADGEYLIRDPISVDADGAIHLVASVPDGALVRVMEGTASTLVAAAGVAARTAREDAGGRVAGALVFDCVSRFAMLGDRLTEELDACQAALGPAVPLLGCLTFGEVGALGARMPQFHNKTMVVLALAAPT
jgi:hypothetical protein